MRVDITFSLRIRYIITPYNCYKSWGAGKFPPLISYHRFLTIDYLLIYSLAERARREMGPFFLSYIEALFWATIILCKLILYLHCNKK